MLVPSKILRIKLAKILEVLANSFENAYYMWGVGLQPEPSSLVVSFSRIFSLH